MGTYGGGAMGTYGGGTVGTCRRGSGNIWRRGSGNIWRRGNGNIWRRGSGNIWRRGSTYMYVRNVHVMGEHAVLGAGSVINELYVGFVYFWSVFQCKKKPMGCVPLVHRSIFIAGLH